MKKATLFAGLLLLVFSCEDDNKGVNNDSLFSVRSGASEFENLTGKNNVYGDPYDLISVLVVNDSAFLTVSYNGGCAPHQFDLVWSEVFADTDPASTNFVLVHHDGGENCNSPVIETFGFDLTELFDLTGHENIILAVINGSGQNEKVYGGGWNPQDPASFSIAFAESDSCLQEVTAVNVVCMDGIWGNTWFALNDSSTIDNVNYFRNYLRPEGIHNQLFSFVPVPGKKYLVGARILFDNIYYGTNSCYQLSGPSVPVVITCINEVGP